MTVSNVAVIYGPALPQELQVHYKKDLRTVLLEKTDNNGFIDDYFDTTTETPTSTLSYYNLFLITIPCFLLFMAIGCLILKITRGKTFCSSFFDDPCESGKVDVEASWEDNMEKTLRIEKIEKPQEEKIDKLKVVYKSRREAEAATKNVDGVDEKFMKLVISRVNSYIF